MLCGKQIGANQVWALDTSYIPIEKNFVYLIAGIDLATLKVLAHKVAITLEAYHAEDVLSKALTNHPAPYIVNTDQGSQLITLMALRTFEIKPSPY